MNDTGDNHAFNITGTSAAQRRSMVEGVFHAFFGGNALLAVLILGLILVFLAREGFGFARLNQENLMLYRQAGLEYVEPLRWQEQQHEALVRELFDLRIRSAQHLQGEAGLDRTAINRELEPLDNFIFAYQEAADPLVTASINLSDVAADIKMQALTMEESIEQGSTLESFDFQTAREPLMAFLPTLPRIEEALRLNYADLWLTADELNWATPQLALDFTQLRVATDRFVGSLPAIRVQMESWDPNEPVSMLKAWSVFLTGSQWLTASFWQDWYGVLPLLTGSLLVSFIALLFAVPTGVGAAIYVNQMASRREQNIIKPAIEFIAAIPSVVLGFFGIIVLGELIRQLSGTPWLSWWPGFPVIERLNALTAGMMLALVAVPTIFTLAEDALQNVPRTYQEASFALGATRLQTIGRVVLPAAVSGIVSAVLLGFGRVIGETMIVLLCAGNRIAIPDFTEGISVFTQPVHTMTGIIAQEMGEVVEGGIHYRALFMVGLLLFIVTLLINYFAQRALRRLRLPVT